MRRLVVLGAWLACICCMAGAPLLADVLPGEYRIEPVARAVDLDQPQALAVAPDGRIFIAEKDGDLRVVKNGALLSQPFASLEVSTSGEEGLLGVALDPDFSQNGYVYVYYTQLSPKTNRILRLTASGDVGTNPTVILDEIGAPGDVQVGGALAFAQDGMLLATVGTMGFEADAQSLSSLAGKVLRMEPDGDAPSDNPNLGEPYPYNLIYASGVRDPQGLTVNGTHVYLTDTYSTTEACDETNTVESGDNLGWNIESCSGSSYKGPLNAISAQPGVSGIAANVGAAYPGFENNLFVAAEGDGTILRDVLGAGLDTLESSNGFYSPEDAVCPTNLTDVAFGNEGVLYVLSADPDSGEAGLYKITRDPFGVGVSGAPREASAGHIPFLVAKDGSGGLDFWWEDMKKAAWDCSPGHCPPGSGDKYTLWSGDLAAPFSANHAPWVDTAGSEVDDARVEHNESTMPDGNKYFLVSSWAANLEGDLGAGRTGSLPTDADRCNAIGWDANTVDLCLDRFPEALEYPDQDGNKWRLEDFRGKAVKFSFSQFG